MSNPELAREQQLAYKREWWRRRYADPAYREAQLEYRRAPETLLKARLRRAAKKQVAG